MIVQALAKQPGAYMVYCPACDEPHILDKRWKFNNNLESPTFKASLKVTRKYGDKTIADSVCHSHVKKGTWEFLKDCTHGLAGQTVPMVEIPPEWVEESVPEDPTSEEPQ